MQMASQNLRSVMSCASDPEAESGWNPRHALYGRQNRECGGHRTARSGSSRLCGAPCGEGPGDATKAKTRLLLPAFPLPPQQISLGTMKPRPACDQPRPLAPLNLESKPGVSSPSAWTRVHCRSALGSLCATGSSRSSAPASGGQSQSRGGNKGTGSRTTSLWTEEWVELRSRGAGGWREGHAGP